MSTRTFSPLPVVALVAAIASAPAAWAEPPTVTPLMERAFAKLEQGSDPLRWFVHRTRMIYQLSYDEVASAYDATHPTEVSSTPVDQRMAAAASDVR
jgi:hypothetical protein